VEEDGFMTNDELEFCTLCGPLADALVMLDDGDTVRARAIMERVLQMAQELCDRDKK